MFHSRVPNTRAPHVSNTRAPRVPKRITVHDLKRVKEHAENLCFNYEDTLECLDAWARVEELTIEYYSHNKPPEKVDQ
jgi:hypothetical protein